MTTAAAVMAQMTPANKYGSFSGFGRRFCKTTNDKRPRTASGNYAKSNDSTTWDGLENILGSLRPGEMPGVFLGGGDDVPAGKTLACIDLDKCRDKSGEWDAKAIDIIEKAGSYVETSMSGNGLHIFGFCDDSIKSHKKTGIEIYTNSRFIAVTGNESFGHFPFSDISALIYKLIDNEFTTDTPAATIDNVKPTIPTGGGEWERAAYLVDILGNKIDNYADYFTVGGAIAATFGEKGLEIFEKFSENPHYNDSREKVRRDYEGFLNGAKQRDGSIYGFGSLLFIAKKYGVEIPLNLVEWYDARPATDAENARVLVQILGADWLHNYTTGRWVFYDGIKWNDDTTGRVKAYCIERINELKHDITRTPDANTNITLKKLMALESAARLRAALDFAAALLPTRNEEFDRSGFITFANGILDVGNEVLIPHSPDLKLTKALSYDFNPNAKFEEWDKFQSLVCSGDAELERGKKIIAGSCIAGAPDRLIEIKLGAKGTGKSTESEAIAGALEDFAGFINADVLLANSSPMRLAQELVAHKGRLMVIASETPKGAKWHTDLKRVAGGDTIRGRLMHQEYQDVKVSFILSIHTNTKPGADGDGALLERFRLVPYRYKFLEMPGRLPIAKVKEMFSTPEAKAAIFAWLWDGYKLYKTHGHGYDQLPAIMQELINEYQIEEDILGLWVSDNTMFFKGYATSAKELYADYEAYCKENSDKPVNVRTFNKELEAKGFRTETRGGRAKYFLNVTLKPEYEANNPNDIPENDRF
jgi:putative DNA primase/helicase